eukprot:Nk52_evm90s226 gene=Nk52_evmTU90s226
MENDAPLEVQEHVSAKAEEGGNAEVALWSPTEHSIKEKKSMANGTNIQISVSTDLGTSIHLTLSELDNVEYIKQQICKLCGLATAKQCLLYKSQVVEEGTLIDNNIVDGSKLKLVMKMSSGTIKLPQIFVSEAEILESLKHLPPHELDDLMSRKQPVVILTKVNGQHVLVHLRLSPDGMPDIGEECSKKAPLPNISSSACPKRSKQPSLKSVICTKSRQSAMKAQMLGKKGPIPCHSRPNKSSTLPNATKTIARERLLSLPNTKQTSYTIGLKHKEGKGVTCAVCNKKLGIFVPFVCKCQNVYCTAHRSVKDHNCTYDYKSMK